MPRVMLASLHPCHHQCGERVFERPSRKDEASGRFMTVAFNLYTTADHRPVAFAVGTSTVGERVGYEGVTTALPPRIPDTR
jgi:hypothetical protein